MTLDRRDFIFLAAGTIAAHESLPWGRAATTSADPRILSLQLVSGATVAEMKEFYQGLLGLAVTDQDDRRLTVQAGKTPITFTHRDDGLRRPFYHFAFNIPENKVVASRDWQRERTPLMTIPSRLRDPDYPDDVVHFRNWNAHSVFFLDPAGNVVEYIGRHDLDNAASGSFSSKDILYASEIGLVVDDVPRAAGQVGKLAGVSEYRGRSDVFTAMGDEGGLLLVMKRGRNLNFDSSSQEMAAGIFPTEVRVKGPRAGRFSFPDYPYHLAVEE
ncbi:MAG TPA: ring-cleaving dioxygenase [Acidobacteriota bacterium]|nr:ring-cleaving dioxygenase [Acidobacteriota bacterium]